MRVLLISLFIYAFSSLALYGQTVYKTVRKVVPIHSPQNFFLNGGTRALLDGKSRTALAIDLPPNTVEWYYIFTTTEDPGSVKTQEKQVQLLAQLSRLLDPSGVAATAINTILVPSGSSICDLFILDKENKDKFLNKEFGVPFTYKVEGARSNFKSGVVQIKNYDKGTYYLGIRNPSAFTSLYVTVEVAAIVEEKVAVTKTEAQEKVEIYTKLSKTAQNELDYEKSLTLAQKALLLDPALWDMQAQAGLMQLALNKPTDALDSYINAIALTRKTQKPKTALQAMLKQLDWLDNEEAQVNSLDDIRELLEAELKKTAIREN